MKLNNDIARAGPSACPLPLLRVLIERRPGEIVPIDLSTRSYLIISEHGVAGHSSRSLADAALSVFHAGGDLKGGALAYVVVGDGEAHFNNECRIVHLAAAMVFGPVPVAWLASLLGSGGIPVAGL